MSLPLGLTHITSGHAVLRGGRNYEVMADGRHVTEMVTMAKVSFRCVFFHGLCNITSQKQLSLSSAE
jgi:hypothetical protein